MLMAGIDLHIRGRPSYFEELVGRLGNCFSKSFFPTNKQGIVDHFFFSQTMEHYREVPYQA